MLNIQKVIDVINHYHRNKGFIKKITRSSHPAIQATETYLQSLQAEQPERVLMSDQDLFIINGFFLVDYPVQTRKAAYKAWCAINYHSLGQGDSVQNIQQASLDKHSNTKKMMDEFFKVCRDAYQHNNLTEEGFVALRQLCAEGMLTTDLVNLVHHSQQAALLVDCFILLIRNNLLTPQNQQMVVEFPFLQQLQHTMICLEKIGLLTQKNFATISAESNQIWLLALAEMPEDLFTAEVWEGLLNLLRNADVRNFKTDVNKYVQLLKEERAENSTKKISFIDEKIQSSANLASSTRLFSVSPVNVCAIEPATEPATAKIHCLP